MNKPLTGRKHQSPSSLNLLTVIPALCYFRLLHFYLKCTKKIINNQALHINSCFHHMILNPNSSQETKQPNATILRTAQHSTDPVREHKAMTSRIPWKPPHFDINFGNRCEVLRKFSSKFSNLEILPFREQIIQSPRKQIQNSLLQWHRNIQE